MAENDSGGASTWSLVMPPTIPCFIFPTQARRADVILCPLRPLNASSSRGDHGDLKDWPPCSSVRVLARECPLPSPTTQNSTTLNLSRLIDSPPTAFGQDVRNSGIIPGLDSVSFRCLLEILYLAVFPKESHAAFSAHQSLICVILRNDTCIFTATFAS